MGVRRMEQVAVVVEDLEAAIAFFAELGLERIGGGAVEGPWVDRVTGLDGVHSEIAMLQTPDGGGRIELIAYRTPPSPARGEDRPSHAPGLLHVAFSVDDLDDVLARLSARGAHLVGEVAEYDGIYRLCYVRGPAGIILMLAEELAGP